MENPVNSAGVSSPANSLAPGDEAKILEQLVAMFMLPAMMKQQSKFREAVKEE